MESVRSAARRVRIFIGTEPKAEIARKVLECSIKTRTDCEVETIPMIGPKWEYDHSGFKVGTGFSLRRWMIPQFCDWKGWAIYLDADQLVLDDIWHLWTYPSKVACPKGCATWMTYQTSKFSPKTPHPNSSVMIIDCEAAKNQKYFHIDTVLRDLKKSQDREAYVNIMYPTWLDPVPVKLPVEWNHLNVYQAGKTKLLHYTKEPEQPWYNPTHPHAWPWKLELLKALRIGFVTIEEIREAVSKFGIQEDWRVTNGLHPEYLDFTKDAVTKANPAPKRKK